MVFVDQPSEFRRGLPGLLPRSLSRIEFSGEYGPEEDSLTRSLCEALYGDDCQALMIADHPEGDRGGFWASWFLAAEASGSQYDILRAVISRHQGLPGHVVCLALSGGDFHGQQGRSWQAVRGNLHLTLGLRCDLPTGRTGLALTMLPAVAVVDALAGLTAPPPRVRGLGIKWVNDIMIEGCKVGGVLTSARSQEGRLSSCVLGIGLNVLTTPPVAPTPFTPGVTCLNNHISLPDSGLADVLKVVLEAVAHRFEELVARGPAPLLEAYRRSSLVLGRNVEIRADGTVAAPPRKGRVVAIGPDLSLTLAGESEPVTQGRLILLP